MATALERLGLPVRAATSGDRPTSHRWPPTSSWSSTPPSSQSRKTWSSHDGSSQTARAYENPLSTEQYRTSSPFGSGWSGLDVPRPSTAHGSGPPTSPPMFAASVPRPHSPPTLAASRDVIINHAPSSPARLPVASSSQSGETLYPDYVSGGHPVGDHPSAYRILASTSSSSSRNFPIPIQRSTFEPMTIFEAEHGALPSSSHPTLSSGGLGPGGPCHWGQRDRPASSSRPSPFPASDPLMSQQRPWTVHAQAAGGGMAPPPLPDRLSSGITGVRDNGRKRRWAECPSPGRRSTRLASKYMPDGGYEPIRRPISTVPTVPTVPTVTEMPPRRELPFDPVETSSRPAPAATNTVVPALTSMVPAEHIPGPGSSDAAHPTSSQAVEPASQRTSKGKPKTARNPRKTPARPAKPAKTSTRSSTGQFTKGSSPRKGKATAAATQEVSPIGSDPGMVSRDTQAADTARQTDPASGMGLSTQLAVQAAQAPIETPSLAQVIDQARSPPLPKASHPSAVNSSQQPVDEPSSVGTHLRRPIESPRPTPTAVTISSSPMTIPPSILHATSIKRQIAAHPSTTPFTVSPSLPTSWPFPVSIPPVPRTTSTSQPLPTSPPPSTTITAIVNNNDNNNNNNNSSSSSNNNSLNVVNEPVPILPPPTPRAPTPTLSMSEVEAVFDRRLRETVGAYLARLGPFVTEINANLGKLVDLTTQFAKENNNNGS